MGKGTKESAYSGVSMEKKALPLRILQILSEYSDEEHPLNSTDIIKRLARDYGLSADRNTVRRNVNLLIDLGYPISTFEDNGRGMYLENRDFDPHEIRWLIDSVLNCRYLTESYAETLIKKLKKQGNKHFKSGMDHISALREWPHHRNQEFALNMELLDEAMSGGLRALFTYNRMDCDAQLHPIGDEHEVLPLHIFPVNFQYYLVAYEFSLDRLTHFRLDRITLLNIAESVVEEDRKLKVRQDFDPVHYAREHPHMYGGKAVHVTLKMPRSLAGAVYDAFGTGAEMSKLDDTYMTVRVKAALEGMRFFALQYGPNCEVLRPQELRDMVKSDIRVMMERYGGEDG